MSTPSRAASRARSRTRSPNCAPARGAGRDRDLAAGARRLLEQGDPVAAAGRGDRGLQAAGTAAHHVHPAAARRGAGSGDGLAAGARVGDAAQPAAQPDPPRALLVAAQAGADPGRLAGRALAAKSGSAIWPRITPTRSHCPAASAARPARVGDPAGADDGHRHGRAGSRPGCASRTRAAPACWAPISGHRGGGHPDRGADVVHLAGRVGQPRDGHRLVEGDAALGQLVAADPHAEHAAGAEHGAHRGEDLQQQPRPVRSGPP